MNAMEAVGDHPIMEPEGSQALIFFAQSLKLSQRRHLRISTTVSARLRIM
jgi:hypothetical protein